MERFIVFLMPLFFVGASFANDTPYRIFQWERGIGLQLKDRPEMKMHLWFYEWNMFGAVTPQQHSRGDWNNEVVVADDGGNAVIDCPPHFRLEAKAGESGADLLLRASNRSRRDWPELAGIIACFNPGPEAIRNSSFDNEFTSFRGPEGLLKLNKREIHWNDRLRAMITAVQPDQNYVWKEKWPAADPNAAGGFLMRNSGDEGSWKTGIAWERFLSCQGHNPWRCMHLGIHLGPLPSGESRTVRGKIYLVEESEAELLDRYERDFPRPDERANARPGNLDRWLKNMAVDHRFTPEEIQAATGLGPTAVRDALARAGFGSMPPKDNPETNRRTQPLKVLPYPGGRHPRIGFLEGAVRPQRETKLSIFAPWGDGGSYVVADIPEAIWWNRKAPETQDRKGRELLYLAHSHVPTFWTRRGVELEALEWEKKTDAGGDFFEMNRELPNGVSFGTRARAVGNHVKMEQWIGNRTSQKLTGLRVQNCVMLKGAPEFADQSNENKFFRAPYAACRNKAGRRWVIAAWDPCVRVWGNARCPCLHSDPQFPDCPPGETVKLRGWLSFFEGDDIEQELDRIEATGWRTAP